MLIPPDAQMFLSMTKAALALPILAVMMSYHRVITDMHRMMFLFIGML